MARAVETVTANRIFLVQLVRKGVHISVVRHRLMESRVEDSHLRNARKDFLDGVNTLQVSGVVKRSKVDALDDLCFYLRRNQNRLVEFLASVDYTVTDCVNLFEVFDAANLRVNEFLEDELDTYGMLRHLFLEFYFLAVGQLD